MFTCVAENMYLLRFIRDFCAGLYRGGGPVLLRGPRSSLSGGSFLVLALVDPPLLVGVRLRFPLLFLLFEFDCGGALEVEGFCSTSGGVMVLGAMLGSIPGSDWEE